MSERVDLRTMHSKQFELAPGKFRLQISPQIAHVPDDPAAWARGEPITWEEPDHGFDSVQGAFRLRKSWCRLDIPTDSVGYRYQSRLTGGTITVRLTHLGGLQVVDELLPAPRVDGRDIWWDNVAPGLDLYAKIRPGRTELYKQLRGPEAPRRFRWRITESLPSVTPLKLETSGRDNANRADPTRNGLDLGNVRRRIQMAHQIGPDDLVTFPGFRTFVVDERWTGKTIALDENRVPSLSDDVVYPVLIDQDVSETIVAIGDDGHQFGTYWYTEYTGYGVHILQAHASLPKYPGYRFQTVAIPQAATIDLATLTVNIQSSAGSAGSGAVLYGKAHDDAPVWASGAGPANMTRTTANVAFGGAWGASNTGSRAHTVTTIVQEIVNRAGWVSGNSMAFGVQGTLTPAGAQSFIFDLDGGASNIATLTVDYTVGGAGLAIPVVARQYRMRKN